MNTPGATRPTTEFWPSYGVIPIDYWLQDTLPDLPELSESARGGCHFCSVLREAIQNHGRNSYQKVHISFFYLWDVSDLVGRSGDITQLKLVAQMVWTRNDEIDMTYLHFLENGPLRGTGTRWVGLELPKSDRTLCAENIEMIMRNIKTSSYKRSSMNGDIYPTRLIAVGNEACDPCRLVETKYDPTFSQPTEISYTALSYCWGPPEDASIQFKTDRCSLNSRLNGFQVDQVSPILRDAIEVTRALKIPYIWIDAICIVQDDLKDWDRESSRMALVYQNATLTICTPASTTCQQGFQQRALNTTRVEPEPPADLFVSRWIELLWDIEYSTWASRSWALQEFKLSQRVLMIGSTRMHVLTTYAEPEVSEPTQSEGSCTKVANSGRMLPSRLNLQDYHEWILLIEKYSRRKLTNDTDKLPAVSGLVNRLLGDCSQGYLAGHLVPHFDLYWSAELKKKYQVRKETLIEDLQSPKRYLAPSWSWASRSHDIDFGHAGLAPLPGQTSYASVINEECIITRTSVSLAGANPLGRVKSGILTIHGVVIPVPSTTHPHEGYAVMYEGNNSRTRIANIHLDWNVSEDGESLQGLSLLLLGSYNKTDWSKKPPRALPLPTGDEGKGCTTWTNTHTNCDKSSHSLERRSKSSPLRKWAEKKKMERERHHHDTTNNAADEKEDEVTRTVLSLDFSEYSTNSDRCCNMNSSSRIGDKNRSAYGLVIHPASSQPGKYLRVGTFYAFAEEGGGLKYFWDRPVRTVEII